MARRPREDDDDVSLFPFLSILACVIGVLTLMISALALAQMDNQTVVEIEQYEAVKKEIAAGQQAIEQLRQQIADESQTAEKQLSEKQRQLAAARQRMKELDEQVADAEKQLAAPRKAIKIPPVKMGEHKQAISEMQDELKTLAEQIAQLEKEIEQRNLPPDEAEVSILPSGSGLGFEPVFIECDAGSVVLHSLPDTPRIRIADLGGDKQFLKILEDVKQSPKKTIVFLVRSKGLSAYRTARSLCDDVEVRHGKLPVIGQGRIDLKYFQNKR